MNCIAILITEFSVLFLSVAQKSSGYGPKAFSHVQNHDLFCSYFYKKLKIMDFKLVDIINKKFKPCSKYKDNLFKL